MFEKIVLLSIPLYFYVLNFIRAIKAVQTSDYRIRTVIRIVGIFMPLVGIFMGFIK